MYIKVRFYFKINMTLSLTEKLKDKNITRVTCNRFINYFQNVQQTD